MTQSNVSSVKASEINLKDRVVAIGGYIAVRPMMTLTLSSDHRLIDGARAAEFLGDVVNGLSEPDAWL